MLTATSDLSIFFDSRAMENLTRGRSLQELENTKAWSTAGTVQPLGPFPAIKAGTFQDCNHQTGTYKLK